MLKNLKYPIIIIVDSLGTLLLIRTLYRYNYLQAHLLIFST
jgi:hypothetical protein